MEGCPHNKCLSIIWLMALIAFCNLWLIFNLLLYANTLAHLYGHTAYMHMNIWPYSVHVYHVHCMVMCSYACTLYGHVFICMYTVWPCVHVHVRCMAMCSCACTLYGHMFICSHWLYLYHSSWVIFRYTVVHLNTIINNHLLVHSSATSCSN